MKANFYFWLSNRVFGAYLQYMNVVFTVIGVFLIIYMSEDPS